MEKGKTEYISKTYDIDKSKIGSMRDIDPKEWKVMGTGSDSSNSRVKLNRIRKNRKLKMVS